MFSRGACWVWLRALPYSVQFEWGSDRRESAFPADTQEVLPRSPERLPGRFLNASLMFRRRPGSAPVYRLCEVSHSEFMSTTPVRRASRGIGRGRPVAGALGRVGATAFTRALGGRTWLPARGRVPDCEVRHWLRTSKKMRISARERAGRGPASPPNPGQITARPPAALRCRRIFGRSWARLYPGFPRIGHAVAAKRSVASMRRCNIPGSLNACPASSTMWKSASGHARCRSHAVAAGVQTS